MRWLLALLLALVAAAGAYVWLQNPERRELDAETRAGASMHFVGLSEGVTAYRLEGPETGPLVVLVHGFSTPSYLWDGTVEALNAAGFRSLRFDLYGRGLSDRPPGDYTLARFTRQLDELLDQLAPEETVHLVGLSMGGLIVSDFTARQPERVGALALIAPFNTPRREPLLEAPVLGDVLAQFLYFPRQVAMQRANFADPALFERYRPGFEAQLPYKGFRRAILSTFRHVITQDPLPVYQALGRQRRPVLLIWGEADAVVPIAQAPRLTTALGPGAELVRIPGAGHLPQAEAPQAVHGALIAHLLAFTAPADAATAAESAATARDGPPN